MGFHFPLIVTFPIGVEINEPKGALHCAICTIVYFTFFIFENEIKATLMATSVVVGKTFRMLTFADNFIILRGFSGNSTVLGTVIFWDFRSQKIVRDMGIEEYVIEKKWKTNESGVYMMVWKRKHKQKERVKLKKERKLLNRVLTERVGTI